MCGSVVKVEAKARQRGASDGSREPEGVRRRGCSVLPPPGEPTRRHHGVRASPVFKLDVHKPRPRVRPRSHPLEKSPHHVVVRLVREEMPVSPNHSGPCRRRGVRLERPYVDRAPNPSGDRPTFSSDPSMFLPPEHVIEQLGPCLPQPFPRLGHLLVGTWRPPRLLPFLVHVSQPGHRLLVQPLHPPSGWRRVDHYIPEDAEGMPRPHHPRDLV